MGADPLAAQAECVATCAIILKPISPTLAPIAQRHDIAKEPRDSASNHDFSRSRQEKLYPLSTVANYAGHVSVTSLGNPTMASCTFSAHFGIAD
jgi:hypothetical protein